jgi:hypothetical protein
VVKAGRGVIWVLVGGRVLVGDVVAEGAGVAVGGLKQEARKTRISRAAIEVGFMA